MASRPEYASEILERIEKDGIRNVCVAYKKDALSPGVLQELCRRKEPPEARLFVASYPFSPADLLETLERECCQEAVVKALAENPASPSYLLSRLARHKDPNIRALIAKNPRLNEQELSYLLRDPCDSVRIALAENTALDPDLARVLSKCELPILRAHLACNPGLPMDFLIELLESADEALLIAFAYRKNIESELVKRIYNHTACQQYLRHLAMQEGAANYLPPALIASLQNDIRPSMRALLARSSSLGNELYQELAKDPSVYVRRALAANTKAPELILKPLTRDIDSEVVSIAQKTLTHKRMSTEEKNKASLFKKAPPRTPPQSFRVDLVCKQDIDKENFAQFLENNEGEIKEIKGILGKIKPINPL